MKRKNAVLIITAIVVVCVIVVAGYYGSIPYISPIVHGQSFLQVGGSSMEPTIKQGATVAYEAAAFEELKVDDIIVFKRPTDNMLIVARIIQADIDGFQTKGDNRMEPYEWIVTEEMYVGNITRIDNPP